MKLIIIRQVRLLILGLVLCLAPYQSMAQNAADNPCDPDYYDSLEARAWLEAQREITQNQNLIFKPDSVLEYTCFDSFVRVLASQAEAMFSESQRWVPGFSLPDTSMDSALQNLVGTAIASFNNANFNHDYLGGRWTGNNYEVNEITGGGSYECAVMNAVWQQAKCMDFISNENNDGFFTFADYQNDPDKRFLPPATNGGPSCTSISARWQTERELALIEANTPWVEDNVTTFFGNLSLQGGANCSSLDPVPTGLVVRKNTAPNQYREKVCLVPGCYYNPTGMNSGNCVASN